MARFKRGDSVRCAATEGRKGLSLGTVYEIELVSDLNGNTEAGRKAGEVVKVHGYNELLPERLFIETEELVQSVDARLRACHNEIWALQDEMEHLRKFGIDGEYNKKFKKDKRKDSHHAKK